MNTLFIISGTSGTGKSTRIYVLIKFLESLGIKPSYLYHKQTTIGRKYLDIGVIGKEINRQGKVAWQGVDYFTKEFGTSEAIFRYLYDATLEMNMIAESAAILSSQRARPLVIEAENLPIQSYARFFSYKTLEEYQARIAGRSGNIKDENSSMWKNNARFPAFGVTYEKEKTQVVHPERYEYENGAFDEPLGSLGEIILKKTQHDDLIPGFKSFCETFFIEKGIKISQGDDIF